MKRRTFLAACSGGALRARETSVRIDHRVFPGLAEMDGNWAALLAASDGKATGVYQVLGFIDVNRRPYYTW